MVALAVTHSRGKICVDIPKPDAAVDGLEIYGAVIAFIFAKYPTAVGLTGKVLHMYCVRVYQDVIAQRRYFAVQLELFAPIVTGGRRRENLYNHRWVGEDVVRTGVRDRLARNHRDVRVDIRAGAWRSHPNVRRKHAATEATEPAPQFGSPVYS